MSLFATEKDQQQAIGHLKSLLTTPGWQTLLHVIDYNMEITKEMILTAKGARGEELDEGEIHNLRLDLSAWRAFRELPTTVVEELSTPEPTQNSPDPYDTPETLTNKSAQ